MEEITIKPGNNFTYVCDKGSFNGSYIIKYVSITLTADNPCDLAITVRRKKAIETEIVHYINSKIKRKDSGDKNGIKGN